MKKAKDLKKFKRQMTTKKTEAEQLFFERYSSIYSKEEFKTQCIFGFYILDFVIVPKLLVVEIDGESHLNKVDYNHIRNSFIEACGLSILHLKNREVKESWEWVRSEIDSYSLKDGAFNRFRSALAKANGFKSLALRKKLK